jgi:hypothetical protein
MSEKEATIDEALDYIRKLVKSGVKKEDASILARKRYNTPEPGKNANDPLLDAYDGKRGSYRRAKKNRRPLIA